MPEPSAALFFFADVLPFFVRAALGTFFDGAAAARDGAGATPPGAVVIRGGKKRLRARPTLGGAPAVATPALAALGFQVAAAGGSRLYSGVSGVLMCASMGGRAPAPARAGRRRRGESAARALEYAARCSWRSKYTARISGFDRAPNPLSRARRFCAPAGDTLRVARALKLPNLRRDACLARLLEML